MKRWLLFLPVVLFGCPQFAPDDVCGYPGFCDASAGEGGVDAPPGCDLTKDPKDSPACVDDSIGLFVDATNGKDSNAGTKAQPLQTVGAAIANTNAQHKRIFVCEGTYSEDIVIDAAHDGVSIYGGWKCTTWNYGGSKPLLGKTQTPAKIDSLSQHSELQDLAITAADATATSLSSIALSVHGSKSIGLSRLALTAGNAHNGADGTTANNYTAIPQNNPMIAGSAGAGIVGAKAHACTLCTDGKDSTGGGGGNGGTSPGGGGDGGPPLNGQTPNDGNGGKGDTGSGCLAGDKGANGDAGANATSPTTSGSLTTSGWNPTAGASGVSGAVAQGGGGGGGGNDTNNLAGAGGGGGCGGCGGGAGTGGEGGGASVALLVLDSTVTVVTSALTAKTAGDGGAGAVGQSGQPGGFSGQNINPGCAGGTGGTGGSGGSGAGGAGGVSTGILWKGSQPPTVDTGTQGQIVVPQQGGKKGIGGASGVNDGMDGVAQAIVQAP